jgi:ribosomal protein S12 methylthiotransferase accessory factor YcaO
MAEDVLHFREPVVAGDERLTAARAFLARRQIGADGSLDTVDGLRRELERRGWRVDAGQLPSDDQAWVQAGKRDPAAPAGMMLVGATSASAVPALQVTLAEAIAHDEPAAAGR